MTGPNRRWQLLWLLPTFAALVLISKVIPGGRGSHSPKLDFKSAEPPKAAPPQPHSGQKLPFKLKNGKATFGDPAAKVKATVYIPAAEGCGNETAALMYRLAKANPTKLSVTVLDFKSAEGGKHQKEAGTSCSGMTINGKQQLTVKDPSGQQRTINLHSNIGDAYKESDLYLALDQLFKQDYGTTCQRPPAERPKPAASQTAPVKPPAATGAKTG